MRQLKHLPSTLWRWQTKTAARFGKPSALYSKVAQWLWPESLWMQSKRLTQDLLDGER
jgi:hypothetical protein